MTADDVKQELAAEADPAKAPGMARFFKTGPGEYGEGDQFLGITVPVQRRIAKRFRELSLEQIEQLLESPAHEHRFVALEILVMQYERGESQQRTKIFRFYLEHTACINNWDLVDTSAPYIVGEHLLHTDRKLLVKLAKSKSLWERRIAIVATLGLIRYDQLDETFAITKLLLRDSQDLIHKACGWALREAGKKDSAALLRFIDENYSALPRTTLRYAIERFPEPERRALLTRAKPIPRRRTPGS